jgi:hypothetical protein
VGLRAEKTLCEFTADCAAPHDVPAELGDHLAGATPLDRINYSLAHIMSIRTAIHRINEQLKATEPDPEKMWSLLSAAHSKLNQAILLLTADPNQWNAMAGWSDPAESIDQANYHAPTTYLLYAMRQLLRVSLFNTEALEEEDTDKAMELFTYALLILDTVILVFHRDDVRSVLTRVQQESAETALHDTDPI